MTAVRLYRTRNGNHDVYQLRWYANGSRRCQTIGKIKDLSKREAESRRREKEIAFATCRQRPTPLPRITLKRLLDRDRDLIEADVRPGTLDNYRSAANHATTALGVDVPASRIGRVEVARIKKHVADQGLSKATISRVIQTLRAAFYRAQAEGLVADNPFKGADKCKQQSKAMRIFSDQEINAILECCSDDWWLAFLRLAFETGLRRNELLSLMWSDIDFDRFTVRVVAKRAGSFEVNGRTYPILPFEAKDHEFRAVPTLTEATCEVVRRLKERGDGSRYVFLRLDRLAHLDAKRRAGTLRARPELVNNLLRDFHGIQKEARALLARRQQVQAEHIDWEIGSIHDCRKTFGCRAADVVPMRVLQGYMGHAKIETTAR